MDIGKMSKNNYDFLLNLTKFIFFSEKYKRLCYNQ